MQWLTRRRQLLTLAASLNEGALGAQLDLLLGTRAQATELSSHCLPAHLGSQACSSGGSGSYPRLRPGSPVPSLHLANSQSWVRCYSGTAAAQQADSGLSSAEQSTSAASSSGGGTRGRGGGSRRAQFTRSSNTSSSSAEASSDAYAAHAAAEPAAAEQPRRRGRPPRLKDSQEGPRSPASADAAYSATARDALLAELPRLRRRPPKLKDSQVVPHSPASADAAAAPAAAPAKQLRHQRRLPKPDDGSRPLDGVLNGSRSSSDTGSLPKPGPGEERGQAQGSRPGAGSIGGGEQGAKRGRGGAPAPLRLGKPMDPSVDAFLHLRGVDTTAIVAALPVRAAALTLKNVQATWALLVEYEVPDLPQLLSKRPSILSVDPEDNLRPKFEALGIRGAALGELFSGHRTLPYTVPESFKECLSLVGFYIASATAAGLLPPYTSLSICIESKPRQWAAALVHSTSRAAAVLEALQRVLGLSDAQLGAAVARFPMLLVHAHDTLTSIAGAYVEFLGQPIAARLIVEKPMLLRVSLDHIAFNIRYLREDLGWSPEEVASFMQAHSGTFGHPLYGSTMTGHLLQVCEEEMGRSRDEMLRNYASALRCSPRRAAPRVAFLAQQGLLGGGESPRFMKDTEAEWERRLRNLNVDPAEWLDFERTYWEEPSRRALLEEMAAAQRRVQRRSGRRSAGAGAVGRRPKWRAGE